MHVGFNIVGAEVHNDQVQLRAADANGTERTIEAEHVIAATGYQVDLNRLAFLESDLQSAIDSVEGSPNLSSHFESSVPGLYFVGISAANTFGPMLRFAFGADFAAHRLSRHLAKSAKPRTTTEATTKIEVPGDGAMVIR